MDFRKRTLGCTALMLGLVLCMPRAWSHGDGHEGHHAARPQAAVSGKPVKPTDAAVLVDQDGRKLRLASDALADKIVVVSFVYTNCTDICPMVSHTFAQLQQSLAPLMEKKVRLVSLTVDPVRDTPARLKEYSEHFAPKAGWLWLTGDVSNVAQALQAFGIHITRPENHPGQILIGDAKSGRWTRLYDIDKPQQVLAKVDELLAAQRAEKAASDSGGKREPCTGTTPQAASAGGKPGCVAQPG
ncbi:SCO family protein [Ramlibacter sp. AN1133]|uniref:SCO family protein n=1 Tax=Ramlibacter sp. AN1133 TaxID=3133429 RepID=UPI0030BD5837